MAFSWAEYLETCFNVKHSGDFMYIDCVFCGHREKLWIKISADRQWGWCFRCQTWTDLTKFIMAHRGLERFEAIEFIKLGKYTESLATALQNVVRPKQPKPRTDAEVLPKEYEPVKLNPSNTMEKLALKYLRRRGLNDVQIVHHAIGFCATGKYYGRIIVPTSRDGHVVYFVARAFLKLEPKYLNPSKDEVGTGKSECIFNYDSAKNWGEAILCEGVFDALSMGERGIAIFGKALSDEQRALLFAGFKRVGVCLDNDAKRERLEIVEELTGFGITAYPLTPSSGKDANEARGEADTGERSELGLLSERMGDGVSGLSFDEYGK